MRLGILSDTHDELARTRVAVQILRDAGTLRRLGEPAGRRRARGPAELVRALSGHAHFPSDQFVGSVRRINPGALHRADEFTVAVLELGSGELQLLRVTG
jgi:predicted phosphodiesterase